MRTGEELIPLYVEYGDSGWRIKHLKILYTDTILIIIILTEPARRACQAIKLSSFQAVQLSSCHPTTDR